MRLELAMVLGYVLLSTVTVTATVPTFDFTASDFQKKLDKVIEEDTTSSPKDGATIRACKATKKDEIVCTFRDAAFQSSVAAMKKYDLINGQFSQNLTLTLTSATGKVAVVRLNGDRGDPPNMFAFIGATMDVFNAFDGSAAATSKEVKTLADDLGLMRGDSAEDIGKFRSVLKPFAAAKCLAVPSDVSTGQVCVWTPRF